jgi:uncharacterized protein (UPF0303 family)
MSVDELIAIVEKQEELLRFSQFTRRDVWDLGNTLVTEILDKGIPLAVSIRQPSGFVLFQYAPENTNPNNNDWMTRKFNTVRDLEISTLLLEYRLAKQGRSLRDRNLDPALYVAGGGGFPIKVSNVGLAAVLVVSGLPGLADHDAMITGLSRFLKIDSVPRVPLDAAIEG